MLNLQIKNCNKCELCQKMPFGPLLPSGNGNLVIITDFPSKEDASVDELYYDHLGLLLKKILKQVDITNCYVTSVIKCFPPTKKLQNKYVKECHTWLIEELKNLKPKVLITLGNDVYKYLHKYKIGQELIWVVTKSLKIVYNSGKDEYDKIIEQFQYAKDISIGKLY